MDNMYTMYTAILVDWLGVWIYDLSIMKVQTMTNWTWEISQSTSSGLESPRFPVCRLLF